MDAPTLELYFRASGLYRDYSGIMVDDSSAQQSKRLNTIAEGPDRSRDFINSASSGASGGKRIISNTSAEPLRVRLLPSSSFDLTTHDTDMPEDKSLSLVDIFKAHWTAIVEMDYRIVLLHSQVILARSIAALFLREKLVVGSLILHIFFAINFWWIMDNSSEDTNPVIGFFAVSGLVLIVANVQFGYYLFSNNEVFLKENSRGLYSCFLYWLWAPLPFMILRGALGLIYGIIVVDLLDISNGYGRF